MHLHKRLPLIFQALVLMFCISTHVDAKTKSELTPAQARQLISQAAQKKDFSQEFAKIVDASDSVEGVLISTLSGTSNRWEERWFSAITLGKRRSNAAKQALLKAVEDELFIVRQAAVQGLSYFEDEETAKAIRSTLNDSAMVVRSEAVDAIAARKDVGALSMLEEQLYKKHNYQKGRSMWIRPQIVHTVGQLGDAKGLEILQKTLRDKDPEVSERTCQSLQTLAMKNQWDYPVRTKDCVMAWQNWFAQRKAPKA